MLKTAVEWAVNTGIALGIFWTVYYGLRAIRMVWQSLQAPEIEYRDHDEEDEDELPSECDHPPYASLRADLDILTEKVNRIGRQQDNVTLGLRLAGCELDEEPEDEEGGDA